MSLYDYMESKRVILQGFGFYALVMAAMRKAHGVGDDANLSRLQEAFPETWKELEGRFDAPGGVLKEENYCG